MNDESISRCQSEESGMGMDLEWQLSHPVISSELALTIQDSIVDGFIVFDQLKATAKGSG